MVTKERFGITVRLVCFGMLLTAVVFRFGHALHSGELQLPQFQAQAPVQSTMHEEFPTLLYTPPTEPAKLTFTTSDAEYVQILNWSGASIDAASLICEPLHFDLSDEPLILILHTHATEAYSGTDGHRTTDTAENVVRIGQEIAQRLQKNGIGVIHDTTLIDRSGYYDSYVRAAEIIEAYLQEYPSIQMVIDVHRDSVTDASGTQIPLTAQIDGEPAAQLMLVMGTDAAGLYHPHWRKNLSFALKLQSLCEQSADGIFRDLNLRSERYNQHLTPHSILIEVGAAGNSMQEALRSAQFFGDMLTKLLLGA